MGMFKNLFGRRSEASEQSQPPEAMPVSQPVDKARVRKLMASLMEYKSGKAMTDARIQASENWWKLRNQDSGTPDSKSFKSRSGWLHNVIVTKHADAMEAYPEANLLPREQADQEEAQRLSAVVPCILELNHFEDTYSHAMWQKTKTGTAAYKVFWDKHKLGGLGDISIERVSLLNLYWEPGVTHIQDSRYVFHTELVDKEVLVERYPQLNGKLKDSGFLSARFLYDDNVKTSHKATVIDCYYKTRGKLHFCKFVGDNVLYASENDPATAQRGFYDHGLYPYVLDPLYPIEGSPCGYGYVDICRNPQTLIDILNTAYAKNARVGAMPRYFSKINGNINEEEFADLDRNIVHVNGNVDEASLRRIEHNNLDGNYIAMLDRVIDELRETSGNTEAATGQAPSGVTAASGIAALQEAAGKRSKDSTRSSYRAFSEIVEMVVELIRQFYDMPRQFRIVGQNGQQKFISYSNENIRLQHQGYFMGMDMGYRKPAFDIKISAQRKNVYTKVAQNELAIQLFGMGAFNPQMADQILQLLKMMDFDGKEDLIQSVSRNGTLFQKLVGYMQIAMELSPDARMQAQIAQDFQALTGQAMAIPGEKTPQMPQEDGQQEHAVVEKARQQANEAAQPT